MKRIINTDEGLIKARINPREENCYLITDSDVDNIKSTSIHANLFLTLTSISFGGFISILITGILLRTEPNISLPTGLKVLFWIFVLLCALFLTLSLIYLNKTNGIYRIVKSKSSIDIIPDDDNVFYISKAKYGANDKFWDVKNELNNLIKDNKLEYSDNYNKLRGDPIVGTPKLLILEYFHSGSFKNKTFKEDEFIKLPE